MACEADVALPGRREFGRRLLALGLTLAPGWGWARDGGGAEGRPQAQPVLNVLNRLSFGPAPGDLARVQALGVDAYVAEQLQPERIPLPDDFSQRLAALDTLKRSQLDLIMALRQANQDGKDQQGKDQQGGGKDRKREIIGPIVLQTALARLMRAVESPRQLEEVLVDFWFNHFNVFSGKGLVRVLVADYEQRAIRPHVLGRFRDLLGATARHPAMLFYLDNWLSVAPGFTPLFKAGPRAKANGLNENYARELMELHTLGVDGGYSQQDVTELARMLTGWTFDPRPRSLVRRSDNDLFVFEPRRHDGGDKLWLGRRVTANGQAEGEAALDLLAAHPATARRIGFKLAQYFVADQPPSSLVDQLAQRFLKTEGDLRAVMQSLLQSREFRQAGGNKFKSPYRFVVSALRAAGLPVRNARPLIGALDQMGMPLYGCQTPDGYKNTEAAWLSPDGLNRRINLSLMLATGRALVDQVPAEEGAPMLGLPAPGGHPGRPLEADHLLATLGESIGPRTRATVAQAAMPLRAGLVLGSPDFQRY